MTHCILEHHYLLELQLAQPDEAEKWVQGYLKVNLYGTKNEILEHNLTPRYTFITEVTNEDTFPHVPTPWHAYLK